MGLLVLFWLSSVGLAEECLFHATAWNLSLTPKLAFCTPIAVVLQPQRGLNEQCLRRSDELLDLMLEVSSPAKLSQDEGWWQEPQTWAVLTHAKARPLTLYSVSSLVQRNITIGQLLGFGKQDLRYSGERYSGEQLLPATADTLVALFVPDLSATDYHVTLKTAGTGHTLLSQHLGTLEYPDNGNLLDRNPTNPSFLKYDSMRCSPNLAFNAPSAYDFSLHQLPQDDNAQAMAAQLKNPPVLPMYVLNEEKGEVLTLQQTGGGRHRRFLVRPSLSAFRFPAWYQAESEASEQGKAKFYSLTSLYFNARLMSHRALVSAHVADYDAALRGYPIYVDLQEPGPFRLQVSLVWMFGGVQDRLEALGIMSVPPYLINRKLGNYGNHAFRDDEARRMMIIGSGALVMVAPDRTVSPANRSLLPRCNATSLNAPGRWLHMGVAGSQPYRPEQTQWLPLQLYVKSWQARNDIMPQQASGEYNCALGLCRGDPANAFHSGGASQHFGWFPYGCVLQYYSKQDLLHCVSEAAITRLRRQRQANGLQPYDPWDRTRHEPLIWMHTSGDSTIREIPQVYFTEFKGKDIEDHEEKKFEEKDRTYGKFGQLRISYRACHLLREQAPDLVWSADKTWFRRVNLDLHESGPRPHIWLVDPGWAYTGWLTSLPKFLRWLDQFVAFATAAVLKNTTDHPLQVIWHEPLWMYAQAHGKTHDLTLQRVLTRANLARLKVATIPGVIIFNATEVTMARWGHESYDGLHYLSWGRGAVSFHVAEFMLNGLFPNCPSDKPLELTNEEKAFKKVVVQNRSAIIKKAEDEYNVYHQRMREGVKSLDIGVCIRKKKAETFTRYLSQHECQNMMHGKVMGVSYKWEGQAYTECMQLDGGSLSYTFGVPCSERLCLPANCSDGLVVCFKDKDTKQTLCQPYKGE
eukprot:g19620.t1